MALRRPAAFQRRAPGWRRSGDESYWNSLISEDEPLLHGSHPSPRPQSAIVGGGQLDTWLEHLRTMQSKVHNPSFTDRTTSIPVFDYKQRSYPSFSASSSSCGSSSLCESSPGSQDSLHTGFLNPPRRRGSWEKAHIMQSPKKEQAQFSYLMPVKIGWLPIQRRVMMAEGARSQNQGSDNSAGQVKLKEPITPTFQRNEDTLRVQDSVTERSHTSPSALGVKTWRTPDQDTPVIKQVQEKTIIPAEEEDRCVGRQAFGTGWKANRVSTFPGGYKSNKLPTGTSADPDKKTSLMKTTITEPPKHSPLHRTTSADPSVQRAQIQTSHTPLQKISSVQPVKATTFYGISNSSDTSQVQDNPPVTAVVPQNKAALSTITISSRKVSRSASFTGSNSFDKSPSPPVNHQPMDPNSRQLRVQRKATIVKVTEKKVISTPGLSTNQPMTPPASYAMDTVVRRRKATIIKVTEQMGSYGPAKSATRNPEYRHSYTEGLCKSQENSSAPSHHRLNSVPYSSVASNTFSSSPKNHGTLHRSTLNLFVSRPPATAPAPSEVSSKAVGQRSDRLRRPLSCYGDLIGHTEPSKESVEQSTARKWSFELPQGTHINPVNSDSGFISPGKTVKEAGQPVADALSPRREEERALPSVGRMRRASPSLELITAPDPHYSQEEVLALNAAAIIANIKLQRQLSKKKTPSGDLEDSTASPQGNTDERKCIKSSSEESQHKKKPHVPLRLDHERSSETISLQQVLQGSRPDFISRTQSRVRELEQKAKERRERLGLEEQHPQHRRTYSMNPTSVNGNLFKPRDGRNFLERNAAQIQEVKPSCCQTNLFFITSAHES